MENRFSEKRLNKVNAVRFARRCKIDHPECLSMRDMFDALRFCRIQQEEVRKYAVPDRNEGDHHSDNNSSVDIMDKSNG